MLSLAFSPYASRLATRKEVGSSYPDHWSPNERAVNPVNREYMPYGANGKFWCKWSPHYSLQCRLKSPEPSFCTELCASENSSNRQEHWTIFFPLQHAACRALLPLMIRDCFRNSVWCYTQFSFGISFQTSACILSAGCIRNAIWRRRIDNNICQALTMCQQLF